MTATGLPFLVTITRSWVPATSSMTWLKCAFTEASDCVVMTRIVVRVVPLVNVAKVGGRGAVKGVGDGLQDFATLSDPSPGPRAPYRSRWERRLLTTIKPTSRWFAAVRGSSVWHLICTDAPQRTPSTMRPTAGGQGVAGSNSRLPTVKPQVRG